ncbi:MAG: ABC transporter substrate-binding protein [Hyphomicrobiales bacterium]|nr:ABC transporter substrate-binding protein [Hyphomicrobiales bacterium]
MIRLALALTLALFTAGSTATAQTYIEPPALAEAVAKGTMPAITERLPRSPAVVDLDAEGRTPGQYGGELRMLMSQARDTRMMVVYGYARLVGYDTEWNLAPDILERIDVEDGRVFTLHLRKGHKWSDGAPFTSEDFRFYWQDVANHPELSPGGPDRFLQVDGQPPRFEILDETTVRYMWHKPNPGFLPALAGARPEYIYMPAHYLRQFHSKYADAKALDARVSAEGQRNWVALFTAQARQYRNDNPELPSLQPWVLKTQPPSTRFIFERNPYYHRVDANGRQLPYIDRVALTVASPQLIPAKTAAGEADLQARSLSFENYAVLKQGESRNDYQVHLWRQARGSELSLYPNLNVADEQWRAVVRNADFRRALSLAINRDEINQVIYFGLAREGNDTVLPQSPLFEESYEEQWADFDLDRANTLLDNLGLQRTGDNLRRLPDGRPIEIVVETSGEDPVQVAILQLVRDAWTNAGIRLIIKPEERQVLRNRVFSGLALMSVWYGLENALAIANFSPHELAPTAQVQLNWPKWGQFFETGGTAGEPIDMAPAQRLADLYKAWMGTEDEKQRRAIWHDMLAIRADNTFTIGTVRGVPQPVVVSDRLHNVPEEGIYNWEPGAHFGLYRPDTFWFEDNQ